MTEQLDWREKQPQQAAYVSKDLKCCNKAKDITSSIAWRRELDERGSARRSSMKGRERAIVSQTNIGTVSTATLGSERRVGARMGFSEHTILN